MGIKADSLNRPISIHAPREGSDALDDLETARRAAISIHAPREGSDWLRLGSATFTLHFYPRSPRGERPVWLRPHRGSR